MEAETTTTDYVCVDLPEEVVVEIMSWLPPDSLIRFKVVSKSWYALIKFLMTDSEFVAKHLRHMKNDMSSSAFIYQSPCTCEDVEDQVIVRHSPFCLVSVPRICRLSHLDDDDDDDDGETDHIHHVIEDLPRIPFERVATDRLEYHCNGVIVLTRYESGIFRCSVLCNPAIMEFRVLPKSMFSDHFDIKGGGLGYHCRASDYKLVRFGYDWMSRNSRAEVYSLITNSWREIKFDSRAMMFGLEANDLEINGIGVFYKGVIYWHIRFEALHTFNYSLSFVETPHDKILCFDVSDETFHCLPLSDTLQSADDPWYTKWHTLSLWNESLALFKYFRERQGTLSFEVWVMDDCFGSWRKQLVVGPLVGIEAALTFWTDDEILLQEKYERLVSYNVHSQKLRNLAIDKVGRKECVFEECVFQYVKSLVSVK